MTRKTRYLDKDEQTFIEAYERGEFVSPDDESLLKRKVRMAASDYLRKDARINIRLSSADLEMLKRRAAVEGLPYQTLISSVLHKFVSGRL